MKASQPSSSPKAPSPTAPAMPSPWVRRLGGPLLAIAFVISLGVHAALLGLQFRMPEAKPTRDRGLEVVLVNARHSKAPEQADVLAQANVDGGGTSEQQARPKSPLPPQPAQQEGDALVEAKRRTQEPVREQKQVLTRDKAPAKVAAAPKQVEFEVRRAQGLGFMAASAAQQRAHAREQLGKCEGLDQVVVGAEFQPPDAVFHLVACGQEQYRHRALAAPQGLQDPPAIQAR